MLLYGPDWPNKYHMKLQSYQVFAKLLEGHINEASTSMDIIADHPGGAALIKTLHQTMRLAHDQDYRQVEKISWSELKESLGAWVIIIGSQGTGAIRATTSGNYEVSASTGQEPRSMTNSRGGNVIDFLKGEIGRLQKFYVGQATQDVDDKRRKRKEQEPQAGTEVSVSTLTKKFKPLWMRAITTAIADVKGHIANQIKNDAFEKAAKKLEHVRKLQNAMEVLEQGTGDTPSAITDSINLAVLMAASHHYPEQTGHIARSYGRSYSAARSEGGAQLLKDIAGGDQKKLGTVLAFFKRGLISG